MFLKKGKDTSPIYIPYLIDFTSPLTNLILVAQDLMSTGKGKLFGLGAHLFIFFGRGIGMRYSTSMTNKR